VQEIQGVSHGKGEKLNFAIHRIRCNFAKL
jgi:hypothetical protein